MQVHAIAINLFFELLHICFQITLLCLSILKWACFTTIYPTLTILLENTTGIYAIR